MDPPLAVELEVAGQRSLGFRTYRSHGYHVREYDRFTQAELEAIHSPEVPPATLREFVARYAAERGIQPRTTHTIHQRLTNFEKLLGRPAKFEDLNDTTMNLWTAKLFDAGLAARGSIPSWRLVVA